ncbi:uncharacterized protein PAC_07607 [Phialocephala subalpina]|uniref:Uncharacterized protein n=1 Tax=Phialocephala subalpina TaxID=576137 RepID=A0A1L7WY92_9HELO|nr:uncharacterized protein PAC_07607 [Phialocephala subalpina]
MLTTICWPFLRLELFSAIHHNRKLESEAPKKIVTESRWNTLGICCVHSLPTAITVVLLVWNFCGVFFEPVGASNQNARLNALQFAAKLHEVLIAASLSAVILTCVQYETLHGRGVALGSLFASFQVTDVGSLWSPGLWATGLASGIQGRHFLLVLLVVLTVILGAVVGPSSAILMLPSLGYWDYRFPAAFPSYYSDSEYLVPFSRDLRFFVGANISSIWPDHISFSSYPSGCTYTAEYRPPYCPLGGYSSLLSAASPYWIRGSLSRWNITMETLVDVPHLADVTGIYYQYIEGASSQEFANTIALTQTAPSFANNFLASVYGPYESSIVQPDGFPRDQTTRSSLSLSNGSQILGPVAGVACRDTDFVNDSSAFSVSTLEFPRGPSLGEVQTWSSDATALLAIWNKSTEWATLWMEPPDMGDSTPSIAVVYANSYPLYPHAQNSARIVTCSVFASWQPTGFYMDPFIDNFVHTSMNDPKTVLEEPNYLLQNHVRPVKFDIDWANSALPPDQSLAALARLIQYTSIRTASNSTLVEDWIVSGESFAAALSIFVADIMSRLALDNEILVRGVVNASHSDLPSSIFDTTDVPAFVFDDYTQNNLTEFRVNMLRYGFSYSIDGLTRRLAAAILLTHALIAMIYVSLVIYSGWTCHGLRSPFEIVVLAINSPSSEILENTSAGISRLDTYRHVVKVRETSDTQLGFVLDDDGSFNGPVMGKRYGRVIGEDGGGGESGTELVDLMPGGTTKSKDASQVSSMGGSQI